MRALLFTLCLCFGPLLAQAPTAFPRGEVIPKVECASDARFSYALYLPSNYREDRNWPVLFGFSPVAFGEEPVRSFQKAAERFGWIVVGSNDSKNGPLRPALEAAEATWKDVRARFKVDPKRSYGYGFSGGSRMALRLALKHPRNFAGLISMGAFGIEEGVLTGLGHLRFYLGCGLEDFNHWELLEGREELRSRGWTALANRFEGGHRLPKGETAENLASSALSFMQLGAMQAGWVPRNETLELEFRSRLAAEAAQAQDTLLGLRRWKEVAALFPQSPEALQAAARIAALDRDPSVTEELKLEAQYKKAAQELGEMPKDARYREELARHLNRLKAAPPAEQRMIRCLLGVPVQNYQIALGDAYPKRDWERVLALATSLAALEDREGWPCIYACAALVQLGKPTEALSHLRTAQARGYRKPEAIRALPELRVLHGQPEFEAVLQTMDPGQPR